MQIEAPHQRRSVKPGLRARQTAGIGLVVPKKTRVAEAAIAAGSLQVGGMHNGDHVPGLSALKILIARGLQVIEKIVRVLAKKSNRVHLRVDGLGKRLGKSLAENVGAEIFQRGHRAHIVRKHAAGDKMHILAGLVYPVMRVAAVDHPKIIGLQVGAVVGNGAKLAVLRPSARRPQLRANERIHAAIDGPVESVAHNKSLARRAAETGREEAAFPWQLLDWMPGVRKIKYRDALDIKQAVIDFCRLAHIKHDARRRKCPLRFGQFAGCHPAVMDHITLRASLFHHLAGKGKRSGACEGDAGAFVTKAGSAYHVIQLAGLGLEVVFAVAGGDVLVIAAAIEGEMAARRHFARGIVVAGLVGAKDKITVIDFYLTAQRINIARFFLRLGSDNGGIGGPPRQRRNRPFCFFGRTGS